MLLVKIPQNILIIKVKRSERSLLSCQIIEKDIYFELIPDHFHPVSKIK